MISSIYIFSRPGQSQGHGITVSRKVYLKTASLQEAGRGRLKGGRRKAEGRPKEGRRKAEGRQKGGRREADGRPKEGRREAKGGPKAEGRTLPTLGCC